MNGWYVIFINKGDIDGFVYLLTFTTILDINVYFYLQLKVKYFQLWKSKICFKLKNLQCQGHHFHQLFVSI